MATSKTDDERIQAALDAALDSDTEEEEEENEPVVMGPPRPPSMESQPAPTNEVEELEHMMQQLLMDGQGSEENNFIGDILGHLKSGSAEDPEVDGATLEEMMQRLAQNQTERAANTDEPPSPAEEDLVRNLMGGLEGEGGADAMIQGMMEDLLSKDMMYEPMQHVVERFPAWLEQHKASLDASELKRRQEQYTCFRKIVKVYEQPSCDNMGALMELMQEVQEFGQPPIEIIQDIAPGIQLDDDGNPNLPFSIGDNDSDECCIS